jgi:hypothetical protein
MVNRVTEAYLAMSAEPESPFRTAGHRLPLVPSFGKVYGARQFARPLFVPEEQVRAAAADLARLLDLIMSLPDRLYGGDVARLCADLGMAERAAALAVAGRARGSTPVYCRPDLFYDGSSFTCLELNTGSELGAVDWTEVNEAYLRLPEFRAFADEYRLGYVDIGREIAAVLRALASPVTGGADPVVALLDVTGVASGYEDNYVSFVEHMAARGIDIRISHIKDLSIHEGKLRLSDGTPVDVALRYFTLEEICAEEQAEEWLEPVLRADEAGGTVFFASLDYGIYSNKGLLAMICEMRDRGELSADEAATIARIMPNTRRVTPELWDECRTRQQELVLKPCAGLSGSGVTTGWTASADEWEKAFQQALTEPYIAQDRVEPMFEPLHDGDVLSQWVPVYGLFLFPQGYCGGWVRTLPVGGNSVINFGTGAMFTTLFTFRDEQE